MKLLWKISTYIWPTVRGVASVECPYKTCVWSLDRGHSDCERLPNVPAARLVRKVDWGRIAAMALLVYIGFALVMDFVALVVVR